MTRDRKAFLVYLDLDPLPGELHLASAVRDYLERCIGMYFKPYRPEVWIAPNEAQLPPSVEARVRKAFLVMIDLDPVPGVMHVEENAQFMLHRVLESVLTPYDPAVSIAPDELQPKKEGK